ncbi:MAG: membrane protein insertion efficiency factor YidD [Acidobacteriota bacterium]|nr:membrane protein insertion efficiency factor YidD [Acidobacteriota bacterium]
MSDFTAAPNGDKPARNVGQGLLRLALRFYKALISPVLHTLSPSRCLYLPTCSEYAYTAISRFGIVRGSWLAARRLSHCHPWGKGGLDPVPERLSSAGCCAIHAAPSGRGRNGIDHLP